VDGREHDARVPGVERRRRRIPLDHARLAMDF
jgi:hypothetical protein